MKEYTRLEYIESDGNQWIDTGVKAGYKGRVLIDFAYTKTTPLQQRIFGATVDNGDSSLFCFDSYINGSGHYAWACQDGTGNFTSTVKTATTDRVLLDIDGYKGVVTMSGAVTYSAAMNTSRTKTGTNNIYLMSTNQNGSGIVSSKNAFAKLYSCRIYEEGTIVREYIPVKNSEGVCGVYDQVDKKFYASQGSSAFTGGAEIEDSPLSSPYGFRRRLMNEMYLTKITTIRINQKLTDPAAMITRIVDEGGIEAIRANSHRYVGVFDSTANLMSLRQLDDNDGTKYLDGTAAPITTLGNDVWMKLPQFFYKAEEYETDVWDITFAYGSKPDDTFKEWDGKDLIGVYKAYVSSSKMYSLSGIRASSSYGFSNFQSFAKNRGSKFSLVRWKHYCMMGVLFLAYYGTTYSNSVCGIGDDWDRYRNNGVNDNLGMTDTVKADDVPMNFWGLENWWGLLYEFVEGVSIYGYTWSITDDNGSVRKIDSARQTATDSYAARKMFFGEFLDLVPTSVISTSSYNKGFCNLFYNPTTNSTRVLLSGYHGGSILSGAYNAHTGYSSSQSSSSVGTRLSYRGDYIITD